MKEIKEGRNTLWMGTLNIIKISILTKLIVIKYNPNQNSKRICCRYKQSKIDTELQRKQNIQNTFQKE